MSKIAPIILVVALFSSVPSFAQDALTPAETKDQTPTLSEKLVAMTDQLVKDVEAKDGDCDAMFAVLQEHRRNNKEFMASLDYATEQADTTAIERVHANAQKLGTLLGACYSHNGIKTILAEQAKNPAGT